MISTSEKRMAFTYGIAMKEMTISQVLAAKAVSNANKVFMTYLPDGREYTYAEIHLQSSRIANSLLEAGIGKGDHVAVLMENCPEQMLTYFALGKIGAVAVPVNTAAKGKLLTYYLTQSDAVAIIAEQEFEERVAAVLADVPAVKRIFYARSGQAEDVRLANEAVVIKTFESLLCGGDNTPEVAVHHRDLAMLIYTSGTTGPSKANMLLQSSVIQWGINIADAHGYRFSDVVYISLPINHANAYFCLWGALLADGAVAMARRFSVSGYWRDVVESKATLTNLLGSMVNMLWSQPENPELDSKVALRACVMSPVPKFAREWEARYRTRIVSSYGLSDYCNATAFTVIDPYSKLGSAGKPRSGIEIRIVDDTDTDVPPGETGEIVLRNNNAWAAAQGYYKMPEVTLAAIRNGWFHTGDLGRVDEDGYLWFVGRMKDAIRRRGENISSQEVEALIMQHPAVADAAVFPVSSEMSEDEVAVSIIVKENTTLTEEALIQFCISNMAHYMVPRFVQFTTEFPRTESQKVRKVELRAHVEANRNAVWDREKAGITVKR